MVHGGWLETLGWTSLFVLHCLLLFALALAAIIFSSAHPSPPPRALLTDTIRTSWGYKGFIVSDEGAIHDIFNGHQYAVNGSHAVADAVNAGCDQNDGLVYGAYLGEAVAKGYVSEAALTTALSRVLRARFQVGAFDPPASVPWTSLAPDVLASPAHRQLALEAAQQAIVLLKNQDGVLPLDARKLAKVAVVGPAADNIEVCCIFGAEKDACTQMKRFRFLCLCLSRLLRITSPPCPLPPPNPPTPTHKRSSAAAKQTTMPRAGHRTCRASLRCSRP